MRLWGKVVSGYLLAIAVFCAAVAITVPEARVAALAAAAISLLVARIGVPFLVETFITITGDE